MLIKIEDTVQTVATEDQLLPILGTLTAFSIGYNAKTGVVKIEGVRSVRGQAQSDFSALIEVNNTDPDQDDLYVIAEAMTSSTLYEVMFDSDKNNFALAPADRKLGGGKILKAKEV